MKQIKTMRPVSPKIYYDHGQCVVCGVGDGRGDEGDGRDDDDNAEDEDEGEEGNSSGRRGGSGYDWRETTLE